MSSASYLDASLDQKGPLSKLYSTSVQDGLLYPSDLADLEHFAVFRIRERQFETSTLRTTSKPATNVSQNIFLPMPAQLQTGYSVNYQNAELGGAGAAVLRTGGAVFDAIDEFAKTGSIQKIIDAGSSALDNFRSDPTGAISSALETGKEFGARAFAESDNPVVRGVTSTRNVAANPYQAVFFSSPNFRSHSFSYTLFARNKSESETIRKIIRAFKSSMLPSLAVGDLFFKYPKVFEIEFRHDDFLFEIGTSVMTGFDVNYHGEGTPSYFDETKAPTNVQITMQFQEVNILTAEDVGGEFSENGKRR